MILSGPEGHNLGNPVNESSVTWLIHEKGCSFAVTLVFCPLSGLRRQTRMECKPCDWV